MWFMGDFLYDRVLFKVPRTIRLTRNIVQGGPGPTTGIQRSYDFR